MNSKIISAVSKLKKLRIPLPKIQFLPDDKILDSYERDLGFSFPSDYRYFLKEASDSILNGKDSLRVTVDKNSPRELFIIARNAWQGGVPRHWLPICEDNGNYYCITANGNIHFWSHDGATDEHWLNLATWIEDVWINEE